MLAFSCKRRGFCPGCGARRMAETAALLADEVLPALPPRQWVISSATGAVTLVQRFGSASSCSSTRSFTSTSSRPPRQGAGTRRTRLAGA